MHTYYGSDIIFGIAVLNEPKCEEIQKGNFIYSFKIFYSLKESTILNKLKKEMFKNI
jgi:hypothetical protein